MKGDRIDQVYHLAKISRYATKVEREADKRKHSHVSNAEISEPNSKTTSEKSRKRKIPAVEVVLISSDLEIETPPPKRTKRNDTSARESTDPGLAKHNSAPKDGKSKPLRDTNGRFLRRGPNLSSRQTQTRSKSLNLNLNVRRLGYRVILGACSTVISASRSSSKLEKIINTHRKYP